MEKINIFVESLTGKKRIVFLVLVILICIISIGLGIYSQYFYQYSESDPFMLGIHVGKTKTSEEFAELKSNFLNIFTNELHINSESVRVDKIETSQSVVYTGYTIENEDEAYYNVDLNLPILNVNDDNAKKINAEIKSEFNDTANRIMRSDSEYTIYNVSYVAYINENIVSIVIKENSKYGNNSEAVRIKTYCYDISSHSEVSLDNLIDLKGTNKEIVQEAIDETIKTSYDNSQAIANEFGTETVREDPESEIYKLENAEDYFLTDDGYVYIIYDYGENEETNEMDIVIF